MVIRRPSLAHISLVLPDTSLNCIPSSIQSSGTSHSLSILNNSTLFSTQQPLRLSRNLIFKMKVTALLLATVAGVSAITTTLPKSAGATAVPTAIPVKGSYDGKMKRFERSRMFSMNLNLA